MAWFETLHAPWALALLFTAPLVAVAAWWRRPPALRISTTSTAMATPKGWRTRLGFLPPLLRGVAVALVVIALARPRHGSERVEDTSKGVAIQMVLDRSSSMGQPIRMGRRRVTRLDAAKEAFRRFVHGDGDKLEGRPRDLVGVVAFARYPETAAPVTRSHETLDHFLNEIHLARERGPEDGTAIGDALALAGARLHRVEETLKSSGGEGSPISIKSRVIVLLTDGEETTWLTKIPMAEAAEKLKEWGVKVYAIGIGIGGEDGAIGPFGMPRRATHFNPEALRALAETTGGAYRRADSAEALSAIYAEIDRLERSEIAETRFVDYQERFQPWAVAALILLGAELLVARLLLRRQP